MSEGIKWSASLYSQSNFVLLRPIEGTCAALLFLSRSLETDAGLSVTADSSEESGHSIDIEETLFVDVVLGPEGREGLLQVSITFSSLEVEMGADNLVRDLVGVFLGDPVVAIGLITDSALSGVVGVERPHESIVLLSLESVWDISDVLVIATEAVHPVGVGIAIASKLHVFFVRLRVRRAAVITLKEDSLRLDGGSNGGRNLLEGEKAEEGGNSEGFHVD